MEDVKNIDLLKCYVAKVLPLVYDDSLSYYEVLCKVVDKINEMIPIVNTVSATIREEVDTILNQWKEDGTLDTIINENIFSELNEQVESNTTAIDNILGNIVGINTALGGMDTRLVNMQNQINNLPLHPFTNKTIGFFGDSITKGTLNTTGTANKPFPTIIGELTHSTIHNFGVGGASATNSGDSNRTTFQDEIENNELFVQNLDYAFVMFGTNDFHQHFAIGDRCGLNARDNYVGGLYNGIKQITNINNKCNVILLIPPYDKTTLDNPSYCNSYGYCFNDYKNKCIEVAEYMSIPCIDLSSLFDKNNASLFMDGNVSHYTQDGYNYIARYILSSFTTTKTSYKIGENILPPYFVKATHEIYYPYPSLYSGYRIHFSDDTGYFTNKVSLVRDTVERYKFSFYVNPVNPSTTGYVSVVLYDDNDTIIQRYITYIQTSNQRVEFTISIATAGLYHFAIYSNEESYIGGFNLCMGNFALLKQRNIAHIPTLTLTDCTVPHNDCSFINGVLTVNLQCNAETTTPIIYMRINNLAYSQVTTSARYVHGFNTNITGGLEMCIFKITVEEVNTNNMVNLKIEPYTPVVANKNYRLNGSFYLLNHNALCDTAPTL